MKEIVLKLNKDNKRKAPGYAPEMKGRKKIKRNIIVHSTFSYN